MPSQPGREGREVQQPARTEVGADAGVRVVGTIALGRQLTEQLDDARSRGEGLQVVGADGHGARRAYAAGGSG